MSGWQSVEVSASQNEEVYISEINYAGSQNSQNCKKIPKARITCANDKWIELYNKSSKPVNLNGWVIHIGRKRADPEQYASTIKIDQDLLLKPNSATVILNSNKNLVSTLELAGELEYHRLGSLFGISSNQAGSKYIRVALSKNGSFISKIDIDNLELLENKSGIIQSNKSRFSINFTSGEPAFTSTQNAYFINNYATPGTVIIPTNESEIVNKQIVTAPKVVEKPAHLPKQTVGAVIAGKATSVQASTQKQALVKSPKASSSIPVKNPELSKQVSEPAQLDFTSQKLNIFRTSQNYITKQLVRSHTNVNVITPNYSISRIELASSSRRSGYLEALQWQSMFLFLPLMFYTYFKHLRNCLSTLNSRLVLLDKISLFTN
ncbi:MAG: lamin tail domain-containing protein [Patescibacteria group bacterium]